MYRGNCFSFEHSIGKYPLSFHFCILISNDQLLQRIDYSGTALSIEDRLILSF